MNYDHNSPNHQRNNAIMEGATWIANLTAVVACIVIAPYFFKFSDGALTNEIFKSYGDSFIGETMKMITSVSLLTILFLIFRTTLLLSFSAVAISIIARMA